MKRVLIVLGAFLWGIVVFRVALGIHFPTEAIKNRAAVELSRSTNDSMQVKVGDIGLASLIGLEASDTIVYTKNAAGESVPSIVLDSLSVVLSPMQTMMGALGLSIDANLMGGNITADISGDSFQPASFDVTTDITTLDLSQVPISSDGFEADLKGMLTTHVEGSFPQEKPHKNSEGRFTLQIDGLGISGAKASGIELPALDFSEATIAGLFKNGKLEITDANIISESIGLNIEGDIILAKVWSRSRLRLTLELKLGSEFSLIAKMLPQLKNNKVGDEDGKGIYKLNVIGTIKNPRIKTNNRNSSRRPSRTDRPETKDIEKGDVRADPDAKSPEERRRERRERIEARKRAQEKRKRAGGVDLPSNPRRDIAKGPMTRVPALERDDEDEDEDIIDEPSDEDIIEPSEEEDDDDFDPGQDDDDQDEPSDEDE